MSAALQCSHALALATARRVGISEGDALRLEEHVEACPTCRAQVATLDHVVSVALSARSTGRFARALGRVRDGEAPRFSVTARPRRAPLAALVGVAALALLGVAAGGVWSSSDVTTPVLPSGRGHANATTPTRLSVGHASLELAAGSAVSWEVVSGEVASAEASGSSAETTVHLESGAAHVEVDPAPHLPFRIVTDRFTVVVTGTRFDVTLDGVTVLEGSVEVWSPEGALLSRLSAGQRWELIEAPVAPPPEPTVAAIEPPVTPLPPDLAPSDEPRGSPREPVLAEASASTPAERFARAASFEASDPERAVALYRALEREGGVWAQNALFARASLLLHHGDRVEGRRLLERYLREHPDGANAADADALLAAH